MSREITFLIKVMSGGGAERVISLLTDAFARKGKTVNLIITHQNLSDADLSNVNKNINVISLPDEIQEEKKSYFFANLLMLYARLIGKFNSEKGSVLKYRSRNYSSVKWLKKFFRTHKNSAAVAFLYDSIFLTLLSVNKSNKVIISERGDPQQSAASKTVAAFMKNEFPKANNIVFQSPDAEKWYEEKTPASGTVIFNPVKAGLPEHYHGERNNNITTFCRITNSKNLIMLVRAFSLFLRENSDYRLRIIGNTQNADDEDYLRQIKDEVEKLKVADYVDLEPFSNNVHNLIKKDAMYFNSSDHEGMSNAMLEAMAIGMPVVCTDCPAGGARAVIKDGENGLLVPVGDAEKTYEAMKKITENPDFAKELSRNAADICNELSVDKIIKKWAEVIND